MAHLSGARSNLLDGLAPDETGFEGVTSLGVDEHVWHHVSTKPIEDGGRGPKELTGMVALTRDQTGRVRSRLLDLVPGRFGAYAEWLKARNDDFRAGIAVATLDPFHGCKNAIDDQLQDAVAVLDAFHVTKLGTDAVDHVRRRVQQTIHGHRGRKGDPLYGIRTILRCAQERLTDKQRARSVQNWRFAHLDESSAIQPDGQRLYVVAAALSTDEHETGLKARMHAALQPGQTYLHWNDDRELQRRCELARLLAGCAFSGALLIARLTSDKQQEHARKKILSALLPQLQWAEATNQVVLESRHQGDAHDRKTIERLRRGQAITAGMRIDHVRKREDQRLWIADALVSCYVAARVHGEAEPWEIVNAGQLIEVREL